MSVIIILISASLVIAAGFLMAFIWSVSSGQYDDDYTPSVRMLFDDNEITPAGTYPAGMEHGNSKKAKTKALHDKALTQINEAIPNK